MNPLQVHLAALRRRRRLVALLHGAGWLGVLLLAAALGGGWLDWRLHLPSLVRALLLTGTLAAAGCLAWRYLVRPLQAPADDLTLALQVEARYPILRDSLASAVQFLEQPPDAAVPDSPALRQRAIDQALARAAGHDFTAVVDPRGARTALLGAGAVGLLALAVVVASPGLAWTGLVRLADPYGAHAWPRQTTLEVAARSRVARGEAFEVRASLRGVLPERALVQFRWNDSSSLEQTCDVETTGEGTGRFAVRLDPGRVQRAFRFQVQANDAVSGWREVVVLPPPQLVPLDGRPSPQIHLDYPDYTGLEAYDLPDGTSSIEAVAGTRVRLRGGADRAVARAWLEYPAELAPALAVATGLAAVAVPPALLQALPLRQIPARLEEEGRVLTLDFLARASGLYVLHLEDDTGLGSTRLIDLRVWNDPVPVVHLDRPAKSQDSLDLLPGADVTLVVRAEDPQFAVRSVLLPYSVKREGTVRGGVLALYDGPRWQEALAQVSAALAGGPLLVAPLRPTHLHLQRRWSLEGLGLREGDLLTLHAVADDFDDVTVGKPPGRSHEVEIRIVAPATLEVALNESQARVQQELLRVQKQQQDALTRVAGVESQAGPLTPPQLDELVQAEQVQQQVRARVGTPEEGLRSEVARILQTLRDNRLPRSSVHDRMEAVASELERLARERLEQIEPRLRGARREQELAAEKRSAAARSLLREAREHQEEVNNTLRDLLELLEPWSSTQEIRGEAKLLLQEQRRLAGDTARLGPEKKIEPGRDPESLTPEQKTALERAAEAQGRLAERTTQLLHQMQAAAEKRRDSDPETADALREAAQAAAEQDIAGKMKQAGQEIRRNQLARAAQEQQGSAAALDKLVRTLEERREEELDRLAKKLREAEEKLADLAHRQEELRKKAREAEQLGDAQQREQALRRLAREQEQLRQEAQELVRELTRLRAERSAQALSRAGARMGQAGRQMQEGGDSGEQQDEALDRLDDALQELQQAREDTEEELAREKTARLADQVQGIRQRQEALLAESARIHRAVLQSREWTRPLLGSLRSLDRAQRELGRETTTLAEEKLGKAQVFLHLLSRAAEHMEQAGARMASRVEQALDRQPTAAPAFSPEALAAEDAADAETQKLQRDALRRLDQLLEALKPSPTPPRQAAGEGEGGRPAGGQPSGAQGQGKGEAGFDISQLRALRALQRDVNQQTEAFHKRHPDAARLSDREKAEIEALHQEQREIAELFQNVTAPSEPREDKP